MKILGLITARGGSKGLPGKNMLNLGGIPLIEHTFRDVCEISDLHRIILSTDIVEAAELANSKFPKIESPFLRPEYLCRDDSNHKDVVQHTLDFLEENGDVPDAVILFQPTSPFRNLDELKLGLEYLQNGADSVIGVSKVWHHPAEYLYSQANGKLQFIMSEFAGKRRQEYPDIYFDNGAFYGFTVDFFKSKKKFFDENSKMLLMSEKSLIDIDTPFDFAVAKGVFQNYLTNIHDV
jgi:CMP-N,N'-diacetyllegionaminic acid synthase